MLEQMIGLAWAKGCKTGFAFGFCGGAAFVLIAAIAGRFFS